MSLWRELRGRWLWIATTVAAGGAWGALLARTAAEAWYWLRGSTPCWAWSPPLIWGMALCAAVALPLSLRAYAPRWDWRRRAARTWPLFLALPYLLQPRAAPLWGVLALVAALGGMLWLLWRPDSHPASRSGWLWDVLAFAVPLALYVSTLAPSVLPGDSGEFQFVAPTLGIPHPTGYPLYLILGKLFSLLPVGSVAFRLNLLSAVAAAGAVWAVYRAGVALSLHRPAALIGAALLMAGETFWSQATIAEKYALNATFVALTLWLGLQWRRERLALRPARGWLQTWALCYGLSLAHHRTMALLAPAYVWLIWATDRSVLRWRSALRLALLAVAPLSLYLLLPLFSALDPPYAFVRLDSLSAFLDLVLGRAYQGGLFQGGVSGLPVRLGEFGRLLVREFGPLGLGLCVGGWAILLRRERSAAWALAAGMLIQVFFALNYHVPNAYVYYLPAYVWLAVCGGAAVDAVLRLEGRVVRGRLARALRVGRERGAGRAARPEGGAAGLRFKGAWPHWRLAWVLLAAVVPAALCLSRLPGMDQRRAYASVAYDHTYGQMALRAVEPGALVIGDWMPATVLWYAQLVEGLAPTAQIAAVDSLEWQWQGLVDGALAAGRAVYLARPLVGVGDRHPLASAGPLVQVLAEPRTEPPSMAYPVGADLGEVLLLGGDLLATAPGPEGEVYALAEDGVEGGSALHLTLYWQARGVPGGDYGVTVRLVDGEGRVWLERQNRHPVEGTYPTSRWRPGQVVADAYTLALPPHLPSGRYELQASMGAPLAEHGLQDREGRDRLPVVSFALHKPLRWPRAGQDTAVRWPFGNGLLLVGYDAPGQVSPGERATVSVQWLVCGASGAAARPRLEVLSGDGALVDVIAWPTSAEDWRPGALMVEGYSFRVPQDLQRIEIRGPAQGGLSVRSRRLPVQVASASAVANFGDQVRLRSYTYAAQSVRAGEAVHLTLEWEALRAPDERYKVFVHVLGENGLPIAQRDNEPLNGTYPTTRWRAGERISDPYVIPLPSGLPAGEYAVEVGLYRAADLSRLPVLDQDRAVVDDKVYLEPVVVR